MSVWAGRDPFEDVLASARAGDGAALFADLWRWLQPPLLRWLAVVAPGAVEDVASEVWISVIRGLDVFDGGEGEFRGWIFTIARSRAIDAARRRRRTPSLTRLGPVDVVDLAMTAERSVRESTELDAALALLRRLTPQQAEVVALRVIVGLTTAETAAVVGRSDGAVRVLCCRGLRTLASQLGTSRAVEAVTT